MKIRYQIYNPAGNITALVIGDNYNLKQRKIINDEIMKKEPEVEQVGFLSEKNIKLTMAGGEFCGNATRCAALYYLNKQKVVELEINNQIIKSGIDKDKKIWSEIPIQGYKIEELNSDIYKVVLKGITILVIKNDITYINLKETAMKIIRKYKVNDDAVGVMFVNRVEKYIKIAPIVWVKQIDTLFFENACGSGTIAVTMLESILSQKSNKYCVMQPSKKILETEIMIEENIVKKAILKGNIETDNQIKKISIKEEK